MFLIALLKILLFLYQKSFESDILNFGLDIICLLLILSKNINT